MLIKSIDYPNELLEAQQSGSLVVFAGAGVSVPSPSGLPLFRGLANQIGTSCRQDRVQRSDREDPDDRFLGRLAKEGVNVHALAATILVGSHTQPHELHLLLLRLFSSPGDVRLVTTNFDTHFSTAAAKVFDTPVETFVAPALPLGDDFAGLVYLHGSADKDPKRCVLTDEDFGRAYLTRAWATRFLAAMFSKYTVLFVGYSHNDTVMTYLARGLPPDGGNRRFAFTTDRDRSLWEFLGIRPLVYQLAANPNEHVALTQSVERWVTDLHCGFIERAQRLRGVAESPPPLEGEDADYLRFALKQADTARVFFRHARRPEWIGWLEKHRVLQPLFEPCAQLSQVEKELAEWLGQHFLTAYAEDLWAAIQRNGGVLHSHLCWCVWRRLQRPEEEDPVRDVAARWIALLLSQPHDVLRPEDWAALLRGCRFPADSAVSLLLFDHVTKPRVCLKPAWHLPGFDDDEAVKVRFELNLLRDREHWAAESWTQLFKPNLAAYAPLLEAVVTANISAAHGLYTLEQKLPKDVDPFRLHRQSIEPHEQDRQDRHRRTLDLLVDAAREILDLLIETKPPEGIALVAKWFNSGIPLLRRLAVHGYGRRTDITPDEKLRWLLAHGLLYRFKTDVFEFLRRTYPLASETAKGEFHRIALQGPRGELPAHLEERTRAYETFNLMVWLQRIAPDCHLVEQSLALLRRQNPEFSPRDFPDVDFWFSAFESVEPAAGFKIDEILTRPPSEFLDELLAVRPTGPLDTSRSDSCGAVAAVTSKDPRWGIEWLRTLATRQLHDADLWHAACQGWRNGTLAPEQWRSTLGLMLEIQGPPAFFESFADVLGHGARREQHAIPGELMPLAQQVAERVWREALEASPPQERPQRDWLAAAINHPGGKLAEFWLQRVSVARKEAGDDWKGIPPDITDQLKLILGSSSGAATHARVVFASRLHYLHSLDVPFTESEILPLLDWRANATWAEQCWHGFLGWGRWGPGLRERLLPQFDQTLSRAAEMPDHLQEAVANHAAWLALFGIENPLADGWITQVVRRLPEPDLERFASKVRQFLDETEPSTAERIWTGWLHQYWRARLLGTPRPLSAGEANAMACWALSVGKHFPDAVTLVAEMGSTVTFEHTALLYWIQEKGLAEKVPDATAALVLLYLRDPKDFFPPDEHATRVWEALKRGGLARPKLLRIREAMARPGQDPGEP